MNYIIGDIGNTSTRICLLNNKSSIKKSLIFDTKKIFQRKHFEIIKKKFLKQHTEKVVLLSCVVPSAIRELKKNIKKTKHRIIDIKSLDLKKIIKINVRKYNQLGSDRIANAVGALRFKNCLIVDFGTATTFDIVKNGVYQGGVIAPGVKLSMMNLSKSTSLLPLFNLKHSQKRYGKNTIEALNAGFIWGYEGLINNIISKITSKWKMNYTVILTGGYASFFKKIIKRKTIVDQNITIRGISKIYMKLL